MLPAGITPRQENAVNDIIDSAVATRTAIDAIANILGVPAQSVAEYVAIARTGTFDLVPGGETPPMADGDTTPTPTPEGVDIQQHGELGPVIADPSHDFSTQQK